MLSLSSIRASNAAFNHSVSHPPVAVFVGGTSGIGEGMARTFAEHTKGNSSIIIVGRNRAAADAILASLPKPAEKDNLKVAREFIQCDVTLMKNVKNTAQDILSRHSKINYLIMSPGIMTLVGRDETPEGIDKKMAVHYYGRWSFLRELLPALKKAKDDGEDAAAMSVFAAGNGGEIDVGDLAMKKNYSTKNAALALPTYNDLMMQARSLNFLRLITLIHFFVQSYSAQYPDLKLIQASPGFVRTALASSSSSPLIRAASCLMPLFRPLSVSATECGEYMWNAIWKTADKPGAWRTGSNGEDIGKTRYFGTESEREKLWKHTEEVVNAATAVSNSS